MIYKFRAWDRTTHKKGVMVSWEDLKEFKCEVVFLQLSEVVLMQFTGQRDKNGVEIYEGDIVKSDQSSCVVEWSEDKKIQGTERSAFLLRALYEMSGLTVLGGYHNSNELEIIGNKFENSELLYN